MVSYKNLHQRKLLFFYGLYCSCLLLFMHALLVYLTQLLLYMYYRIAQNFRGTYILEWPLKAFRCAMCVE